MNEEKDGGTAFPVIYYGRDSIGEMGIVHQEDGMSLREYAAIKLKVPDSGIDWLDEMIIKSKRDDIAEKAMQGIIACPHELSIKGKKLNHFRKRLMSLPTQC